VIATRNSHNPLITFASDPCVGQNINGPSVIRVPEWIQNPLGKYYMYFAHHSGDRIRMAYADDISGPWKIYQPGTLRLEQAASFRDHVASPDVHVDEKQKKIRMYFHGLAKETGQWSGVAFSYDGLNFEASEEVLGKFYFRVFQWDNYYYAIAKDWNSGCGELYRSPDGICAFESCRQFVQDVRHTALLLRGDILYVFHSRKGDAPERIVVSCTTLSKDFRNWQLSEPVDVLKPECDYEGIQYDNVPSEYGPAIEVQQLRDPCIFEENGKVWMFYSCAGEMSIAMAELRIVHW